MLNIDDWFAGGQRVTVRPTTAAPPGAADDVQLFCRVEGSGPWLTFLHGFPTCSWDWAQICEPLSQRYTLLMFDFLGFGDSNKPSQHDYSLFEQADFTEALWRHFGVAETGLVAHDYGSTVAMELLSRQQAGRLAARIEKVVLMNAGLYVDHIRPVLVQHLLQQPMLGRLLTRVIGERAFRRQFASIFSDAHPISAAELRQHWRAITRREGVRNYHRLIRYLDERRQHKSRWERALEAPGVPVRFLWGLEDPVSGRHISDHIQQRIPDANLLALPDVGHYPQLEVPALVAEEIAQFFS